MNSVYQITELNLLEELKAAKQLYNMRLQKVDEYHSAISYAKSSLKEVLCKIGLQVSDNEIFVLAKLDDIDPKNWNEPIAYYPVIPGRISVIRRYEHNHTVEIVWHSKDIANGIFYNTSWMVFRMENGRYDELKAKLHEIIFGIETPNSDGLKPDPDPDDLPDEKDLAF